MQKITLKQVKAYPAQDITSLNFNDCKELRKHHSLEVIAVSRGVYGLNGAVLKDTETGEHYKITARNSTLYFFV